MLKADEFSSVFSFRCAEMGEFFHIQARPNGKPYPRLGLIVAKKTERAAVYRNFAKRIVREFFRLHQQQIGGLDIVVRLRKSLRRADSVRAGEELGVLLAKVLRCRA